MSKRFYPQQLGERKKVKLDITVSDHNFPLSQNPGPSKESDPNWGDDNDDEILLLASQACEQSFNTSNLPDYSMCMQPGRTSTQFEQPSTSQTPFTFKKPSNIPPSITSTSLKDKCNRISSPLPGMTSKIIEKDNARVDLTDDLIFKVFKDQNSDHLYHQLLKLQEDNLKLKSENGKLLEKCVTKEGEASILRTQLKSCQSAVDNARMERIKAQEKVQMEWTDKFAAVNNQIHDLRNQLDFKNLEIISIKERCKLMESNKIKLTQVTVAGNDISSSHRNNSILCESMSVSKRVKTVTSEVQTEDKPRFRILNKTCRTDPVNLPTIFPWILEPSADQHSILEYNEKLQNHTDLTHNNCRIYSTFHRIPAAKAPVVRCKVSLVSMVEDVSHISSGGDENTYVRIIRIVKSVLTEVQNQLCAISQRLTTAFQKEMDEKYMETTSVYLVVELRDLLSGRAIHREEQAIVARRMTATLAHVLASSRSAAVFTSYEERDENGDKLMDVINRICGLLDTTSCAQLYSGLLLSIANLIETVTSESKLHTKIMDILKNIITSRPMPCVASRVLKLLTGVPLDDRFAQTLCPGSATGNLRTDHDQGVLLYRKDSCFLQILLKQIEVSLKCIEKQKLFKQALSTVRDLIALYARVNGKTADCGPGNSRCDCQLILIQVIVYSLRICAVLLQELQDTDKGGVLLQEFEHEYKNDLVQVCRSGLLLLYQCVLHDVEFSAQLGHNEGHLIEFCEILRGLGGTEAHANMLTELSGTFQASPEDMTSSYHRNAWMKSFESFSMTD